MLADIRCMHKCNIRNGFIILKESQCISPGWARQWLDHLCVNWRRLRCYFMGNFKVLDLPPCGLLTRIRDGTFGWGEQTQSHNSVGPPPHQFIRLEAINIAWGRTVILPPSHPDSTSSRPVKSALGTFLSHMNSLWLTRVHGGTRSTGAYLHKEFAICSNW